MITRTARHAIGETYMRLILILVLIACATVESVRADSGIKLVFFSGNPEINNNDQKGGLPALATLLKELRSKNELLFLHGGRAIAPSTLSSFDRGTHMIDLLNLIKPDAYSVGKSAFAFKEDELTLRTREASFPFLSSNLYDPVTGGDPEGITPSIIIKKNGINIGFFSITSPELMQDYLLDRVYITDVAQTIEDMTLNLKNAGADLVVMLSDYKFPSTWLLEKNGIDLALISDKEQDFTRFPDGLQVVHGRADNVIIIDIKPPHQNTTAWRYDFHFEELQTIAADPDVKRSIHEYLSQLDRFLSIEIGTTKTELDTRKSKIRTGENAFGNLVADSLRTFLKTDLGLMNAGGIRGDTIYPAGSHLTRGDMLREIPFRNHVVQIEITGKQLIEALENGFSRLRDQKGRFPHVSGMRVTYIPTNKPFSRVHTVTVGGKKLVPEKIYTMATVNFLANGGDGYSVLKKCKQVDKFGSSKLLWEYVKDYIADQKVIAPVLEGRLTIVPN